MNFTKFTNSVVSFILKQIEEIKKIKGLPYQDLIYKLIDIKNIFKDKIETLKEKADLLNKQRNQLIVQYCTKDKTDGKTPIIKDGGYLGLEFGVNPDYDTATEMIFLEIKKLNVSIVELSDNDKERLEKCVIDNKILESKIVKEEFNGDMYEAVRYFLKEESNTNEKV